MKSIVLALAAVAAIVWCGEAQAQCSSNRCAVKAGPVRSVAAAVVQPVRRVVHAVRVRQPVRTFLRERQPVRRLLAKRPLRRLRCR